MKEIDGRAVVGEVEVYFGGFEGDFWGVETEKGRRDTDALAFKYWTFIKF